MRTLILLFIFLTGIFSVQAQIVIDMSDMPMPGDTLRVSIATEVPEGFSATANDTLWDFTMLQPVSQRVDTFVNVLEAPPLYLLVFIPNVVSNLASPRTTPTIPGLPVTDPYTFYMKSQTSFSEAGYAFTVSGLPFPARYDNPDKLYQFPCTNGTNWSSNSALQFAIPSLVYYSTDRNRVNSADGWGTLMTPFGTFETLRIRSAVSQRDSIYIDSLGIGFSLEREIIEYKWIAKGSGIPVLQINEEGAVATAVYRDSVRMSSNPLTVYVGPDTAVSKGTQLTSFATITGGTGPYQVFWNTLDTGLTMTRTIEEEQTITAVVVDALQNFATGSRLVTLKYPPWIHEPAGFPLKISPNPTSGRFQVTLPPGVQQEQMEIISTDGRILEVLNLNHLSPGTFSMDLSHLSPGLYLLRVSSGAQIHVGKLTIEKQD